MYYQYDPINNHYLKDENGERLIVDSFTKYHYETQQPTRYKFDRVPEADPVRERKTYRGGTNIND